MSEYLFVHNFGPIQSADITVSDLTVLVGPQAVGKSLTAQILYFFRRLEDLSIQSEYISSEQEISAALEWWFGQDISVYNNKDTVTRWLNPNFGQGVWHELQWNNFIVQPNQVISERLKKAQTQLPAEVYIPAGRSLYSFLPPYKLVSRFLASEQWPGYVLRFYETLGRSIRWLNEYPEIGQDLAEMDFLRTRIDPIIKGNIQYGHETISLRLPNDKLLSPTTMAGGQMELWPLWTIVEAGVRSDRLKAARIYIDEPEAHLHPGAQRAVVEMIAYLVNQGTQFVLATHSPYILYTINVLLKASEIKQNQGSLPSSVPPEAVLLPGQVSAYRFTSNGLVHNIKHPETNLIDEDELDQVADDLGSTFTELLEILEARA